jgi:hypothetical protein
MLRLIKESKNTQKNIILYKKLLKKYQAHMNQMKMIKLAIQKLNKLHQAHLKRHQRMLILMLVKILQKDLRRHLND